MLIVVTEHTVNPGFHDAARRRMAANGRAMAARAGFLFRHLLDRVDSPDCLASITGWTDEASYEDWVTVRNQLPGGDEARAYYASIEHRLYHEWPEDPA